MIRRYTFGTPFQTDAVVQEVPASEGKLPYLLQWENEGRLCFSYHMADQDLVYGLGENMRGINKRGWRYISLCTDESNHLEDKNSLYASHNFAIITGEKETFGFFIDYPGWVEFDVGYTHLDQLTITLDGTDADLYIIEADNLLEIVKAFREMIGPSYIPPKWAFGYQQSRFGYVNADDIREVAEKHRKNHLPLDSIYMDIDYMEQYKDFTIHQERFPDFGNFVQEMRDQHLYLVPIIDAGVKVEKGYSVYEEGVEKGFFCKDKDGNNFVAGVWPGRVHFPDFLVPEARQWFGEQYRVLLDQGIEGFWNDMNEPAIFFTEDRLEDTISAIASLKDSPMDLEAFRELKKWIDGLAKNPEDYLKFYHKTEKGMIRHDKVHNLYGYGMTRAAGETFDQMYPDKRLLLFSRASYVGMHRYGGVWTGDNKSWWQHMVLNLKMMPSMNMVGLLYIGADLGGHNSDVTEDLLMRWMELSLFIPLMRNHSAIGSREQEIYRFDRIADFRNILNVRYGLLPYIYSEYMKAALNNDMYFMPLSFVYSEDPFAPQVEDQLMVGDSVMIAPVCEQNANGRYVYLPEDMVLLRFRSVNDFDAQRMAAGHHYVPAELQETLVFLRQDKILLLADGGEYADEVDTSSIRALAYIKNGATYRWYDDDGFTKHYDRPEHWSTIEIDSAGHCTYTGAGQKEIRVELL